ncbi:hypothetical protein LP316_15255 [Thalassotalea sp. LPB0316]|uniref:hypothetical protein n=1 Tax=Thalassotalea sp. LPB0316 TaxID=2769490 RepID=UPI001868FA63|nr:hypothetical protein [Thalassotalea sp. LPB0316]QOL25628.1 hypothetical protein LP316_15255 [Thalassotalea sp. LPB0316]
MTPFKLIALTLLISFNINANEYEVESDKAEPFIVQGYFDYCTEIRPDDEDEHNFILNCVNSQLSESGYDTFSSYQELITYMNKDDENDGNRD